MKRNESDKLEARSDKCNFVGYPKKTKGYFFYSPLKQKVLVSRNATFLENEILSKRGSGSKFKLSEVQEPQNSKNQIDEIEHMPNVVGVEMETQSTF